MGNEAPPKVVVRAYPFAASLELNGIAKPAEVVFVGPTGLIAKLEKQFVQVGEYYQIQFKLPGISHHLITTQVRVLKTYDKATAAKDHHVDRLAEFHFEKLNDDDKKFIFSFITAIGQNK